MDTYSKAINAMDVAVDITAERAHEIKKEIKKLESWNNVFSEKTWNAGSSTRYYGQSANNMEFY
ncbi:hypothetical protein AAEX28_13010 [Lentisphaerota bacterium WC36G]|nr:hypothetical protein LJT99_15835 [Lentisphaerae bacterium WC36]